MIGRPIHVRSTKYDGSPHWAFDSFVVMEQGSLLMTQEFAGYEYRTWKGPWISPYDSRNYFWTDRWYNVIRCDLPRGGGLHSWYCNVTTPAEFDGENLHYVDLDLDVRVFPDGDPELLDEDEFLENSARMGYPPEVVDRARRAVDEILELVHIGGEPFDAR
ncbi:MAG: DUF402 domain-containing protein [Dehalococcoidia bacterium]